MPDIDRHTATNHVVTIGNVSGHLVCQVCGQAPPMLHQIGQVMIPGKPDGPSVTVCANCLFRAMWRAVQSVSLTCRHCGSESCDGECINGDGN